MSGSSGWRIARLDELCDINPRKPRLQGVADTTQALFVPMAAVDEDKGTVAKAEISTVGAVGRKSYRNFTSGDVLFAKITPCMENGKAAIVPPIPTGFGFGSTEFHVLRPKSGTDARLIWHLVRQQSFRNEAAKHFTGTVGQLRVPAEFLRSFQVLVPVAERDQAALANLLDSVTNSAKSGAQHLHVARRVMERFRRAVMIAASSGRLTADWRSSIGRTEEEEGWIDTTIGSVAVCLDRQRRPINAAERAKRTGDVPYYGANGQVGWIDEALFNEELVLVVEDETFVGRVKPFSYRISGPAWVNNHAHILRPTPAISADMLNMLLSYYNFVPLTSGTTGRRKLTQASLMTAPIRVPPTDEQSEIVRRTHHLLALAETLLTRINTADRQLSHASEKILARAFRGELIVAETF